MIPWKKEFAVATALADAQAALDEADKAETDAGNAVEIVQRALNDAQSLLESTQSRCRKSMTRRDECQEALKEEECT